MTEPNILILSMSGLADFMRCPRKHYYGWELMREPNYTTSVVEEGSSIHGELEKHALGHFGNGLLSASPVADAYVLEHPLPKDILHVEEGLYFELLNTPDRSVWVRITPDLVYREDDWVVCRDYKTFQKMPTLGGIDFQKSLYMACLRKVFGPKTQFEHVYIRQTPPGVSHNQKGDCWMPEECYVTDPAFASAKQLDEIWLEAQWAATRILQTKQDGMWYRVPLKGPMHGCDSCFFKVMCKQDWDQGGLSSADIEALSVPRKPIMSKEN